jgi:hypothetical protein
VASERPSDSPTAARGDKRHGPASSMDLGGTVGQGNSIGSGALHTLRALAGAITFMPDAEVVQSLQVFR